MESEGQKKETKKELRKKSMKAEYIQFDSLGLVAFICCISTCYGDKLQAPGVRACDSILRASTHVA